MVLGVNGSLWKNFSKKCPELRSFWACDKIVELNLFWFFQDSKALPHKGFGKAKVDRN